MACNCHKPSLKLCGSIQNDCSPVSPVNDHSSETSTYAVDWKMDASVIGVSLSLVESIILGFVTATPNTL